MTTNHVLVTGASEGIGRAFAERFAAKGSCVIAVARNAPRLEALVSALPGQGHRAIVADLTTAAGIEGTLQALVEQPVALFINNAGMGHYGNFHEVAWAQQEAILELNCIALAQLAHAYLQGAQPGDALINVASILSFLAQPTSAMYAASKAFVTSLSEALWFENKHRDVYVMGLHPGITETQFRVRAGGEATRAVWAAKVDSVVDVALQALAERRRATVICGAANKMIAALPRLLPRHTLVSFLGATRSRKKPS